jgi:FlaA1/EpsC-like NDP-sugar epimerase
MGEPVRIEDLARDMIRLSGRDDDEIDLAYTGLRPGEKLAEELFTEQERTAATRYEQILVARARFGRDRDTLAHIDELLDSAHRRDWAAMDRCLGYMVPGFHMSQFGHLRVASL